MQRAGKYHSEKHHDKVEEDDGSHDYIDIEENDDSNSESSTVMMPNDADDENNSPHSRRRSSLPFLADWKSQSKRAPKKKRGLGGGGGQQQQHAAPASIFSRFQVALLVIACTMIAMSLLLIFKPDGLSRSSLPLFNNDNAAAVPQSAAVTHTVVVTHPTSTPTNLSPNKAALIPAASAKPTLIPLPSSLPPCDPYALPGRLHPDLVFRPYDLPGPGCRVNVTPSDNLLSVTMASYDVTRSTDLPAHLRNKMILVVSDSNDRMTVISLCNQVKGTLTAHMILDGSVIPPGSENNGDARLCVIRGKPGTALVLVFVFNYGISNDAGDTRNHIRPGLSAKFVDIVDTIPRFLRLIAPVHFPELDPTGGYFMNAGAIKPDLIVSQSSLWETVNWMNIIRNKSTETGVSYFVEDAMSYGFTRLPTDIQTRFLPAFQRNFPGVPLVWRNCPPIIDEPNESRPAWVIVQYNRFIKHWMDRLGVKVLDWNSLVEGRGWMDDLVHQNFYGRITYSQMVFSEMEYMWEMEQWKAKGGQ
ncbi:hypothetical protein HK101_003971 [Irineochytrium annulatum]|nr:hypothetical protein HK101_003971 [Irineochytrium annulatum]